MTKFASEACIMEVCGTAQYAPGYLNRQLITLLLDKSLGVPDSSFRELQVHFAVSLLHDREFETRRRSCSPDACLSLAEGAVLEYMI